MLVVFATPFGANPSPGHYRSKAVVQSASLSHMFVNVEVDQLIVSKARNTLTAALPPNTDIVWFVDADVILPENAHILLDIVQDPKTPVVSGLYFWRKEPYLPQVYNRVQPGAANFAYLPVVNLPTEPFFADAVGAGCLVIKYEIFAQLEAAHQEWQEKVRKWQKQWVSRRTNRNSNPEVTMAVNRALELGTALSPYWEFLEAVGEDFYFCEQLRHYLGIRPWVVPAVECGHESSFFVSRQHFEASKSQMGIQYYTQMLKE